MSIEQNLANLTPNVGQMMHESDWLTVKQERIDQFAQATGDHQWIHVDADRAKKESPYKDTIAHGFLTLSLISSLTKEVGDDGKAVSTYPGIKLAVNYGLNKVRFPAPVKVNTRIRSKVMLKEVKQVAPDTLQVVREVSIEAEGQSKPCCVAQTLTRLYF